MKTNFMELTPGAIFAQRGENKARENFTNVDIYDLPNIDLTPYSCLVIGGFADQDFLYEHRQITLDFVNARRCEVSGEGAYTIDTAYPKAQYDPYRPTSYAYVFIRKLNALCMSV